MRDYEPAPPSFTQSPSPLRSLVRDGETSRGAREGACTGAATMPQLTTLRLIRHAAASAAASPTLLFSDW
jgi:hypothetical protein